MTGTQSAMSKLAGAGKLYSWACFELKKNTCVSHVLIIDPQRKVMDPQAKARYITCTIAYPASLHVSCLAECWPVEQ